MPASASRSPELLSVVIRIYDVERTLAVPFHSAVVLGRDADCDVVLPSPNVSRKHATLSRRGRQLLLRDHSSHGTRIAGQLVHMTSRELSEESMVQVGPYHLRISLQTGKSGHSEPLRDEPIGRSVALEQRRRIRAALLEALDLTALDRSAMQPERLRPHVERALLEVMQGMADLPRGEGLERLREELCDEVLGLGPLEPLLRDPQVSEIMLVDPTTIYVERRGRIELTSACFTDDTAVRAAIERIVTPLGRRIDESAPLVDARLADGSRVNAVIPPLALKGPCITIRKFPDRRLTWEDLVNNGSLNEQMASFLSRAVAVKANLVISGGTGSGKTTLLNVLSAAIPSEERIVTIEDAAELKLAQRHVVSLEARPANMEGQGAISIRDLVRNALRMRPDRIVVGECRGGEALDMLQAMNTGHEGSMTTTHANSPFEALQRIETLCLMAGVDLPLFAIRRQVATSIDLVIQQARLSDGSRKVTHISEVCGLTEKGELELRDIFRFVHTGTDSAGRAQGYFFATGNIPSFVDRFVTHGLIGEGACW